MKKVHRHSATISAQLLPVRRRKMLRILCLDVIINLGVDVQEMLMLLAFYGLVAYRVRTMSGIGRVFWGGIEVMKMTGEVALTKPRLSSNPPGRKTQPQPGDQQYGRSAVSNGSRLLPGIDGRNPWVRRCRDLIREHLADLGGIDSCSAAERSIIRRASTLTVELERLEAKFATGGEASDSDLDLYQRTAGNLRRLLEAVGIARRPRDVTPTLADIAAEIEADKAEAT